MIRPALQTFAEEMEKQLSKNDDNKGVEGWKDCDETYLINKMFEELAEFCYAAGFNPLRASHGFQHALANADDKGRRSKKAQRQELADMANILMMLYDIRNEPVPSTISTGVKSNKR